MKRLLYFLPGLALSALVFSCKPDLDTPVPDASALDVSHYVAAGDYLTAGYAHGGLTRQSQEFAYPNILARQFAMAGAPANFEQPYFPSGAGTQTITLTGLNAQGLPQLAGTEEFNKFILAACNPNPATVHQQYSTSAAQTNSLQNLGVPGLLLNQIRKPGLGNPANAASATDFNPYFGRIMPAGDNRTYLEVVSDANPTFFTLWAGMADVTNYALSGASCTNGLPNPTIFRNEIAVLLDSLSRPRKQANNQMRSTRKGVICNLPSIRDFAFIRLGNATELEQKYQAQHGSSVNIWINKRDRQFSSSAYSVVKINFDDVVLIKGLNAIGQQVTVNVNGVPTQVLHGLSAESPLSNDEVLDATEINEIETRIAEYNSRINSLLNTGPYRNQVILGDLKELFTNLRNGINYNGVRYSMNPLAGGISTLDFFTFSPRGQALIANQIIQAMNNDISPANPTLTGFGTRIPQVDVNNFPLMQPE